jgi:hypothetical protein
VATVTPNGLSGNPRGLSTGLAGVDCYTRGTATTPSGTPMADNLKFPFIEGAPAELDHSSRAGLWDKWHARDDAPAMMDDCATGRIAGSFLNQPGILAIEDWGCGKGGFRQYIGDHQAYIGVDGSRTDSASVSADLEHYTSQADAIHLRHVLEHNLGWQRILANAVASFQQRMVLTLFTPFQDQTRILRSYPDFLGTGCTVPDIGFARADILALLEPHLVFALADIPTGGDYKVEQMFLLERAQPSKPDSKS